LELVGLGLASTRVRLILSLCVGNTNFLPKEREESSNITFSGIFLEALVQHIVSDLGSQSAAAGV